MVYYKLLDGGLAINLTHFATKTQPLLARAMQRDAKHSGMQSIVKLYDQKLNTHYIDFSPFVLALSVCMPMGLVWLASKWHERVI
tara:strand:- start:62872 stop:63126 length:255 start_codon:yes stop_codon:yes gene_type:complete